MANTKKYISLDKLEKYNDLIKGVISTGDAAALKSAKDYADSLAGNYDAAGAAATAESNAKAYAKEYADGLAGNYDAAGSAAAVDAKLTTEVARAKAAEEANTALINAIKDGAELDSFKDVEEKLAGYQVSGDYAVNGHKHVMADITDLAAALDLKADKSALEAEVERAEGIESGLQSAIDTINNEESGILAQAKVYTDTSYETAMNAVQNTFKDVIADHNADIKAINDKIGTVAEDSTVVGMIEAVDAKADKNAEDIVTINETIKNIQENAYDDTAIRGLISDNAEAIEALEGTHATDKAALEGAIALKADATALEAEIERAMAAEKANTDEIARVNSVLVNALDNNAEGLDSIKELATWVDTHGKEAATMVENITANADAIEALEGRMDTAEGEIDALQADSHTHDNKTVLDGITAEQVAAWDKAEANVQADWAVNDASSDAYIKNRTHYIDFIATELLSGAQRNYPVNDFSLYTYPYQSSLYPYDVDTIKKGAMMQLSMDPEQKENYSPLFQGELSYYSAVDTDGTICEYYAFGNMSYISKFSDKLKADFGTHEDTGELAVVVFEKRTLNGVLVSQYPKAHVCFDPNRTGTTTVQFKIDSLNGTVHQLDDKFISDNIARTADLEALEGRVETAETKLATIEEGAQVNVIEVVKVNGEALTVTDKAVDIVVPVGGLAGKDEVSEDELSETLAAKINGKAEQSALEAAVEALEGADSALDERLQLVEAQLGDGENSVADLIATAKQEAIDAAAEAADAKDAVILAEAKADSSNKDAVVLAEAQKGIDAVQAAIDAHIAEANVVAGRVTTVEGKVSTLESEMDAVEALAAANKAAHEANAAAIALKASQADLEAVAGRVTTLETLHANFVEASEEEINALFA